MRSTGLAWFGVVLFATSACSSSNPAQQPPPGDDAGGAEDAAGSPDAGPDADASPPPPLQWSACSTSDWPDGYPTPVQGVECTTVVVPLHHDTPGDGMTFPLRVARQKSRAFPTNQAVFQLAGGPGGSSVWQSGVIPQIMPKLLDRFDLIYMDQRGTGGSGYLACKNGYPQSGADWKACGGEHTTEDLDHYMTVDAAHDIDAVRQRLGYGKVSLRGGSYGTRLGLEVLRQHGDTVVAAALDGLLPPDTDVFAADVVAFDRGVNRLVADCAASAGCQAVTTNLAADLTNRRLALRQTPRSILVGGMPATEDETLYLEVLDAALYDAAHYYAIPRAIHTALAGDLTRWDQIMSDMIGQTVTEPGHMIQHGGQWRVADAARARVRPVRRYGLDYVAPGLFATVMCSEYLPNSQGSAALMALTTQQTWGNTYDDFPDGCAGWKVDPLAASLRSPVQSSAKVLLTNCTLDLNTFPEWGTHAAATLPNATSLVFPYATHEAMVTPCGASIMEAYLLADGDVSKVDTSCVQKLTEPAW